MEIVGKIIVALEPKSGVGKSGNPWKKREYVLETQETYPKKIFFSFFGDRADAYPLSVGQMVRLYFDINAREWNGNWFTDISGWKAEDASIPAGQPAAAPGAMPGGYAPQPVPPAPLPAEDSNENLPF